VLLRPDEQSPARNRLARPQNGLFVTGSKFLLTFRKMEQRLAIR